MKRLFMVAALALAACATPGPFPGLPGAPADVANQIKLDEQGALGAELAYKAARIAVELAVDSGVLKGERADRFATLDRRAFAAVKAVRVAYAAGNASNYKATAEIARGAIADLLALAGR